VPSSSRGLCTVQIMRHDRGRQWRGQGFPKGASHLEKFISHIVNYAVFVIKPIYTVYNGYFLSQISSYTHQKFHLWGQWGQTSDLKGRAPLLPPLRTAPGHAHCVLDKILLLDSRIQTNSNQCRISAR